MLLIQIRVEKKVVEMLNLARLPSSVPTKSRKMMALTLKRLSGSPATRAFCFFLISLEIAGYVL